MNQQPSNIPAGLAQGGRGFVLGVVEGVEGVFEKPISGARSDGIKGFFKGGCKGMVGLVARPLSGALDFTSGTLNTIKRVTDTTSEVQRVRLPRFFREDKQVRPYNKREAEGYKLLKVNQSNVFNYI
uniref:ACYPI008872 protein n=2 Tax=Macrosiphini TaxID=33386 RepID=C4WTB6_ACYPI|nr:ACYPI008872 [Acyrthosiphon pisum]